MSKVIRKLVGPSGHFAGLVKLAMLNWDGHQAFQPGSVHLSHWTAFLEDLIHVVWLAPSSASSMKETKCQLHSARSGNGRHFWCIRFLGCYNVVYCLTVLGARSSRAGCQQATPGLPLADPWLGVAQFQYMASSLEHVCVQISSFHMAGHPIWPGSPPTLTWLHLNLTNYICSDLFPNKVMFQGTGS